jgi:hypothetical protein
MAVTYAGGITWTTMRASTTEAGAVRAAEALMNRPVETGISKSWKIWGPGRDVQPPRCFPGRFVRTWSANSVGGLSGNPWSAIAVAELIVEDDILDRLAEV